jgi:hypothetical protein
MQELAVDLAVLSWIVRGGVRNELIETIASMVRAIVSRGTVLPGNHPPHQVGDRRNGAASHRLHPVQTDMREPHEAECYSEGRVPPLADGDEHSR